MTPNDTSREVTNALPSTGPAPEPPKKSLTELCGEVANRNCKACWGRGVVRRIPAGGVHNQGFDLPCRCVTAKLKPEHFKAAGIDLK